ncbi:MAG: ArnT family glycosyltransferase [Crocinitomicaceae bacterium]
MSKIDWSAYRTILLAAFLIRFIAAIFSQGYGMHDDHFLVIEASASWTDGYDYNHWLPESPNNEGPEGHSFTYVGFNYVFFSALKGLGISDPKILMFFNRLLHALLSLLIVTFAYKITEKLSSKKNAVLVGWILALLWVLPFLSVRNLAEIVCIPFILWGIWESIKSENRWRFLWAGMLLGVAISIRYQVGVFVVGMAAVYFFSKQWRAFIFFSIGVLIVFGLTQGLVDYLIWDYPFAEFIRYATYNANEGTEYIPNDNYFMYLLVLMGAFLFPFGLLVGIGFFRGFKQHLLLFVPVVLFILFHSFFPSKQERFILPVLPLFLMLGVMGYEQLRLQWKWDKLWNVSMKVFWALNIPLLLFVSFTYSKKSRVEAMYYFYGKEPIRVLQEASSETDASMLPKFYANNWYMSAIARRDKSQSLTVYDGYHYDYIIFMGNDELDQRISDYRTIYPEMKLEKVCEPSMVDALLRWLNPRNSNEYIEIWKTNTDRLEKKKD